MMSNQPNESAEAVQIRQCRRMLLQALNTFFPAKAYVRTLYRSVIGIEPTYEKSIFVKDLFYLEKKKYLELTVNPLTKGTELLERFVVLTAEGKEIAEQTMDDPALKI